MSDDPTATGQPLRADPTVAADPPVTFADVFAVGEFRALYLAGALNWLGDYLARAAITVLVYQQTSSVLLSAVSFALSYLPWILGGPVLAALAERYPYRRVIILCDLTRMVLVSLILVPGLPPAGMLALLFLAALANPPAQAARSALLPLILNRRRLVVGLAVNASTGQAAQVVGYLAGATLAAVYSPQAAIALNAASFALSAALIARGVRSRPAANSPTQRTHLVRETAVGFTVVFGNRLLRQIAVLVFCLMLFAIVPEGLAAAWAAQSSDDRSQGLAQGMIMAASPTGFVIGGLVIGRLVPPARQPLLIRVLAVTAPVALVPALTAPPPPVVALMAVITGFSVAGLLPVLNGIFVSVLPHGYRARAFGVMQGGMQLTQGAAVLVTGLLAERFAVPTVVGAWSVGGTVLMLVVVSRWPSVATLNAAIAANDPATTPRATNDPATTPRATNDPATTPRVTADATGRPGPATVADATRVTPPPGYNVLSPPPAAGRMER